MFSSADFTGLWVVATSAGEAIDVHSNLVDGAGAASVCTGRALLLDWDGEGAQPSGRYANNIFLSGLCQTRANAEEASVDADPASLSNNAFEPGSAYLDEAAVALTDNDAINALEGAAGNTVVDCLLASPPSDFHLGDESPCIDAGFAERAPELDMDGEPREAPVDIGPDEWQAP
jgi:hypothetical protein